MSLAAGGQQCPQVGGPQIQQGLFFPGRRTIHLMDALTHRQRVPPQSCGYPAKVWRTCTQWEPQVNLRGIPGLELTSSPAPTPSGSAPKRTRPTQAPNTLRSSPRSGAKASPRRAYPNAHKPAKSPRAPVPLPDGARAEGTSLHSPGPPPPRPPSTSSTSTSRPSHTARAPQPPSRAPDGTGAGVGSPPPHLHGTRPTTRRPPRNHPHIYPGPESVQMLLAQGDPPIRPNRHPRQPLPPPQRPREARCL